jgi:hypothetical protein
MPFLSTSIQLDATNPGEVTSLGLSPDLPFEIPLSGCTRAAMNGTSGKPANLLVILSGVAIPMVENPEPQDDTHDGDVFVTTQYVTHPGDEFVWHTGFASLATVDGDAPGDLLGGAPNERNFKLLAVDQVVFPMSDQSVPRVRFTLPLAAHGDSTFDRISYQLHLLIYRASLPDAARLDPTPGEPSLTQTGSRLPTR